MGKTYPVELETIFSLSICELCQGNFCQTSLFFLYIAVAGRITYVKAGLGMENNDGE